MQVAIPIYEGFTALDAIGPYDVLQSVPGHGGRLLRAGDRASTGPRAASSASTPTARSTRSTAPDIVVVPGGLGNRRWLDAPNAYTEWLQRSTRRRPGRPRSAPAR